MAGAGLTLALAQGMVAAALAEGARQGVAVTVGVVDTGGHLVAFARSDGASYMANEVARRKAVTACNFRAPTHALANIGDIDPIVGADLAKTADVCLVAGGVPIMVGGVCVGGLGVGGGRSEQDRAIAAAAVQGAGG